MKDNKTNAALTIATRKLVAIGVYPARTANGTLGYELSVAHIEKNVGLDPALWYAEESCAFSDVPMEDQESICNAIDAIKNSTDAQSLTKACDLCSGISYTLSSQILGKK